MVHKSTVTPNEIQKTIVDQMFAMNRMFRLEFGVKQMLLIDNGVRFYVGGRRLTSFDIVYDRGSDLYDVSFHKVRGVEVKTEELKGVYVEDLMDIIRRRA